MEKNCGISHLEIAAVVPQYQILTKLQKYHVAVALLASGTPANGGGNGACTTTFQLHWSSKKFVMVTWAGRAHVWRCTSG